MYDPLGFLAPFVLVGKKILQEICRKGISWDDPLPEELLPRWERWKADLKNLAKLSIPRCYKPLEFGPIKKCELHHFSDASTEGYGQCSYLRLISERNQVHCSLVTSKARVAPTKVTTIPRLELNAALVSVKMSNLLQEELQYENLDEYFWTDSKVVLGYLNNESRRFQVFVANRVQRIKHSTRTDQWNYVESEKNPADHASRGLTASEMVTSSWFSGPEFLLNQEVPFNNTSAQEIHIGDPEVKSIQVFTTKASEEFVLLDRLTCFSEWSKAVKAIARLQRFIRKHKTDSNISTVEERKVAKKSIMKMVQQRFFQEEIKQLNSGSLSKRRNFQLHSLDPFIDDQGYLRVGGRLKQSTLPFEIKHPVILPKDSHISSLIIAYYHEKIQHQGRGMTINEIRSNGIWIVGCSKAVASHIYKCVKCRKMRRPKEEKLMSDLPEDRMETSPPFTFCGMDCFGPFYVKEGRKEIKRYGLLFTCMCSRAVHIEMLDDMTTDAFINSLRCFLAIRGAVQQIRSDRVSNFVGAQNEFFNPARGRTG